VSTSIWPTEAFARIAPFSVLLATAVEKADKRAIQRGTSAAVWTRRAAQVDADDQEDGDDPVPPGARLDARATRARSLTIVDPRWRLFFELLRRDWAPCLGGARAATGAIYDSTATMRPARPAAYVSRHLRAAEERHGRRSVPLGFTLCGRCVSGRRARNGRGARPRVPVAQGDADG
jgi:hypothetical protein